MPQFGSKDSKRHFTVVIDRGEGKGGTLVPPKEHGLYVSSTPSSAARKAVTKLCAANKSRKVEFHIREITQGSKKKTYGSYVGYVEKLKEPIELKGRVIKYKPVVKLRGMRGGGYYSTLSVNSGTILSILRTRQYDNSRITFTITNIETNERKEYVNIRCLGQGGYGKVFLVECNNEKYVIKISNDTFNSDNFIREPVILNRFMNKLNERCQYKAISQGTTQIDGWNISHIIFPCKGGYNLLEIIEMDNYNIIPKILRDILFCLININKYACNGDLKLENIVYDEETNTGFIIDYGLAVVFPLTIKKLLELLIDSKQISVDIIIGKLLRNIGNSRFFEELYSKYLGFIEKTIDNFGLFWVIIESISDINIISSAITLQDNKINAKLLEFYFNLDNSEESNELFEKLKKKFNYEPSPDLRKKFIDDVRRNISPEKFSFYFNNNEVLYINFIKKVLDLVRVDPTTRIPKEKLLQDLFFTKN